MLLDDSTNTDALTLLSTVDARLGTFEGSKGDSEIRDALASIFKMKDLPKKERQYFIAQHSGVELMRQSQYMQ